ncbi:MAG: HlyD family secretion protein [Pseudomonadota bacterium]
MSRLSGRILLVAAALLALAYAGLSWMETLRDAPPEGFARGNGRIEAERIDIAPRYAGRVDEVMAREGGLVEAGAPLARLDTMEEEASLAAAEAQIALARENLAEAEALILQRESELRLADHELARAESLAERGHLPEAELDSRRTAREVAEAALRAGRARAATARSAIVAAEAEARRIRTRIEDATLTAPTESRVLYRLAEPGEIVQGGHAILTLLDLSEVYMDIFLPAGQAGRLPIGAEARIVLDPMPDFAIPAEVSFVSPEAQFTPRQVETLEEREKLVFRVRVRIPPELVKARIRHVKTGVRGVAWVRVDEGAEWPEPLNRRIPEEMFE